jgi:UDP-galactopyranose mutase
MMAQSATRGIETGLICLSHLRWDFVYQRPQHLLSRIAKERKVVFFEEPIYQDTSSAYLEVSHPLPSLLRAVPFLPKKSSRKEAEVLQSTMLEELIDDSGILRYDLWYYTPMALGISRALQPDVVIFDCMDELSGFRDAPTEIKELEAELLQKAHVVFTGGASLYEAKRDQHCNVHCCPSSIDKEHFSRARSGLSEPDDQKLIPGPRIGFYGVVDERFDIDLLDELSALRPNWHFVIVGPVVKIKETDLPKAPNIHYLGKREYEDLPAYLAGWDVAMLPFAHNSATRFISPTKTPEYLAAGRTVVSTGIRDVVKPYGDAGVVSIANSPGEWLRAIEFELERRDEADWSNRVDELLSTTSWDATWTYMSSAIETARSDDSAGEFDVRSGSSSSTGSFTASPS